MYHHSISLPRGFKYPLNEEPPLSDPSSPRPTRMKMKRRNLSNVSAATQQFLASVAAADTVIPSIEVGHDSMILDYPEQTPLAEGYLSPGRYLTPQPFRSGSPPRTPEPSSATLEQGSQYPDWSKDTPPSARRIMSSNSSDCSDDSFYSGSRRSRPLNDSTCTSPEMELQDPFQVPSYSKGRGKHVGREEPIITLNGGSTDVTCDPSALNGGLQSKSRKNAVWTKDQSAHLWSTYLLYLQDARLTPFRIGVGCIPPDGVVHRVSREARRSWKGPKPNRSRTSLSPFRRLRSRSNTPTQGAAGAYKAWPHSRTATRAHLKDLCRKESTSAVHCQRHRQSRSPTPFQRCRTPEQRGPFNTQDIAVSLATSISESMQPSGPLAKLAAQPSPITPGKSLESREPRAYNKPLTSRGDAQPPITPGRSLESREPRFYKPLTSRVGAQPSPVTPGKSLESREREVYKPLTSRAGYDFGSDIPYRTGPSFVSRTSGSGISKNPPAPRSRSRPSPPLRSPISFDKPRSLTGSQKRRAAHDLDVELSPNGGVRRPGILDEQVFGPPPSLRRVRNRGFSLGDEVFRQRTPEPLYNPFSDVGQAEMRPNPAPSAPHLLPSISLREKYGPPPQLGSPFDAGLTNNTYPRRQLLDDNSAPVGRPFASMQHQTRRSMESFDFGPSLSSKRSELEVKLKEIEEKGESSRNRLFR